MRNKRMSVMITVIVAIGLLWIVQAGAYGLFTATPPEAGRCSQCHTDWPGATHTVHTAFDCSACHADDAPVMVNACTACHGGAGGILDGHAEIEAPNGEYCGYCHEGVGVESRTLTEVKGIFE